jgi:mRNA-degrading endonuclease toxin of MazEF toxin-antitoxin module
MTRFYTGDVVWVTDTLTHKGRRPCLVITVKADGRYGVCPLTHTRQGKWSTNELGGGTYVAAVNRITRGTNTRWVTADALELYKTQLTNEAITAALNEVRRQLKVGY